MWGSTGEIGRAPSRRGVVTSERWAARYRMNDDVDESQRHCGERVAAFDGTSNLTVRLSTTSSFALTSSISTVCGPGDMPCRMIGVPLASAQRHPALSTVT